MKTDAVVNQSHTDDHTHRVHPDAQSTFMSGAVHAMHGLLHIIEHERNARIHLAAAVVAFLVGVALKVSATELAAVFFAVLLVFLAEIFNTAIERTLDLIDLKNNPRIKLIKDMSAGAVLVASGGAVIIGVAIFAPYILELLWPI